MTSQIGHIHDFQPVSLSQADDGTWRERQACAQCWWEIRFLRLPRTPEDEPRHPVPCWCPRCMRLEH